MHVLADKPPSGASPLPHFDLHGSDRTRSALALALGRGLIANLILQAELGQKCGRGLAPDGSVSVTTCMTDLPPSGASPLPHFDLHGSDRTRSALALALGRGLIANLILQAELGQKCGRGLAPDGSGSVTTCMTDPPPSGASPLLHFDLHGSDRTRSALALALALAFDLDLDLRRPVKPRWPNAGLNPWVTQQDAGLAVLGQGWPMTAAHGFKPE